MGPDRLGSFFLFPIRDVRVARQKVFVPSHARSGAGADRAPCLDGAAPCHYLVLTRYEYSNGLKEVWSGLFVQVITSSVES